jgi:membrane dipeptidase
VDAVAALQWNEEAVLLKDSGALKEHLARWQAAEDRARLPVGLILGMEGADPILSPEHVHQWWADGIRIVSLSHYGVSTYGHGTGTGTDGGLFPPAAKLLPEMESLGMILDLTHSSDASALQAADQFGGALMASHQNCRAIVAGERQFPDDLLRVVIERDGVVGVSFDTWMLYQGKVNWARPTLDRRSVFKREDITLDHLADHIDHICQLAGDSRHVGIGSDTDGQGGCEGAPAEINSVADFHKLGEVLSRQGYSDADIAQVFHGNWSRFFQARLPAPRSEATN